MILLAAVGSLGELMQLFDQNKVCFNWKNVFFANIQPGEILDSLKTLALL